MTLTQEEDKFLKRAVELARESYEDGRFPAGALVVRNNEIVAEATSGKWPAINQHGESQSIDEAMNKLNKQLDDCTLFTSMEPCLMCLGKAYWAGISKIVYILPRNSVDKELSYEGDHNIEAIGSTLNRKIEFIQDDKFNTQAMEIYSKWEEKVKLTSN